MHDPKTTPASTRREAVRRALSEAHGCFEAGRRHDTIATVLVARDGSVLRANTALRLLLGRKSFEGVVATDFINMEDRIKTKKSIRQLVRGRRHAFGITVRCTDSAGQALWLQLTCSGLRDARGAITGFIAHAEDICDRKRAESERERAAAELALMLDVQRRVHELNQALVAATSRDEAYRTLDLACRDIFPGHRVFFAVAGEEVSRYRRDDGGDAPLHTMIDASECRAVREDRPLVVDAGSCEVCRACHGEGTGKGYICMGLTVSGRVVGVLHLDDIGDTEQIRNLLQTVEMIAAATKGALSNFDVRDRLREDSMRDVLTGLYNRRYLLEALPVEIERACRLHIPLVVAIVDIDHFKRLNDTYGHEAGDEVLRRVAEVLQTGLRRVDVICRYGGEEFVVVLPATHAEPARQRFNQLRVRMRGQSIAHLGRVIDLPAVSVGLAEFGPRSPDPERLLRAADEALYRAKAQGRDRVELACADGCCGIWGADWGADWCEDDDCT